MTNIIIGDNMVNVYENGELIATVKYNSNLDEWNGSNWQNGGTGMHLGITRLADGRFVLVKGSDWVGDTDTARIVSDRTAYDKIMKHNPSLLDDDKFKDLKKFKENLIKEWGE